MTGTVLDASALLALLLGEAGADEVREDLDGASMSAVNLAEVMSHFAKVGAKRTDVEAMLGPLPVRIVPLDTDVAYAAGELRRRLRRASRSATAAASRLPGARGRPRLPPTNSGRGLPKSSALRFG